MDWREFLAQANPASWEESYRKHVLTGVIGDAEWWYMWLWNRLVLPNEQYSLFNTKEPIIRVEWIGTMIEVKASYEGKNRLVLMRVFGDNPYHPDIEYEAQVTPEERRFPSVGNPFIDEPNYRQWEEWLLVKLFHNILEQQKGLSFLIDRYRQQFHQHG